MAGSYIIEQGLLYRIDTPRQKKLARMKPLVKRLCVPKSFRQDIIRHLHNHYGHYAAVTLYYALSARYFWKSLFKDVHDFCRTCETCQRTKINLSHRFAPLNPIPVPNGVGTRFALDHKVLSRTTSAGSNAVLVVVECFSGFPHFICVPDMTAETTARAIVQHIIPFWGIPLQFQMDKGPSFVSALFKHIAALLGIRHVTTAARSSRSNGQAEASVKRLCEHSKYYARDDLSIEEAIPLCEMNVRCMPHSKLQLSPYEIVFGRQMRIEIPADPPSAPPEIPADKLTYYRWLTTELQRLHKAVKQTRDEQKEDDRKSYDRAHNVAPPKWQINDRVWLLDDTIRPGASKIVTRQRFTGRFIIKNVVKGQDSIGTAYQLINEKTGKAVRNLVTNDRLKACETDRQSLSPGILEAESNKSQTKAIEPDAAKSVKEPKPLRIINIKSMRGKKQYLVRYSDHKNYWCDWVSKLLLDNYKRNQGKARNIKRDRPTSTRN